MLWTIANSKKIQSEVPIWMSAPYYSIRLISCLYTSTSTLWKHGFSQLMLKWCSWSQVANSCFFKFVKINRLCLTSLLHWYVHSEQWVGKHRTLLTQCAVFSCNSKVQRRNITKGLLEDVLDEQQECKYSVKMYQL
jgi:hypothetical protein